MLAASVSISFFSVIVITIIVVISSYLYSHISVYFFLCALLYVCCLLHYGANKVSYMNLYLIDGLGTEFTVDSDARERRHHLQ